MVAGQILVEETFQEVGSKSIDTKSRISIGEATTELPPEVRRFRIFTGRDGDILLRPVVEIPAREVWLYRNPQALKAVQSGLTQSSQRKTRALDKRLLAVDE